MKLQKIKLSEIKPYEKNARKNDEAVEYVIKSIKQCEYIAPIILDENNVILAGHTRYKALKKLGYKEAECVIKEGLSEEQKKKYRLLDNKIAEFAEWDFDLLEDELSDLDFGDLDIDWGVEAPEFDTEQEIIEDEVPEIPKEPKAKYGDIYQLGNHRLMCGDSTKKEDVEKLMNGEKADLLFTDPPYGMKKESEGVLNDNLNYDDLLDFNRQWIPLTFGALKDNGSWYCWGIDEPLMDIYSNILKPMAKENKITFRNLITWNKSYLENGNTFNPFGASGSKGLRMYPIADEKCLFVMCGVQCLDLNADQYWEEYEPIRKYLYDERIKCCWDVPTMKTIAGHSDKSGDHWTGKSQFNLPTKEVYEKFQKWAKDHNVNAFEKEYEQLRKEYEQLRAYFDNADCSNNVWNIEITKGKEKQEAGGHATPKPIALCSRAIKSSSREGEIVLDVFGGSGSTLIACEQLGRACYAMELEPKYIDVIIKRWENLTGQKAVKINE